MFCGAGGSSFGAQNAGCQIIAGIDVWTPAVLTYGSNFSRAKAIQNDIRQISPDQLKSQIGEIDLLLASPECTHHSVARGAKKQSEESKMTAFQVTRFAKEFRPKWIIIENVIQMQSWSKHSNLLKELWDLDYYVKESKLNAQDFGVPQSRRRLYMLCSRQGAVEPPEIFQVKPKPASSIIDTTSGYKFSPLYTSQRAKATIERAERAITALGTKASFLIVYYGTDGSGGWQSLEAPLRTITTLDRFAYVVPTTSGHMMRMLQPEELKLAMGFDKSFKLDIGLTRREKIQLLGNGVCPPVMQAIINSMTINHRN